MGIRIPVKDAVVSGECIQCMQCLAVCPKESLSANPARAIAGTAAAAAIESIKTAFTQAREKVFGERYRYRLRWRTDILRILRCFPFKMTGSFSKKRSLS